MLRDIYNQNVLLFSTYRFKSLLKDRDNNEIYYDEAYMITDDVGERDKNIGCYIAKLSDWPSGFKYVIIPQGCGYLNNKHNLYNTSIPRYFNSFSEACRFATCLLLEFYKLKYIM